MDRGLVNVAVTEAGHKLLVEAAEHAEGADADLVLYSVLTEAAYEHDLEVLDRIEDIERVDLSEDPDEIAREIGESIAERVLADYDVEYTVVGEYVGEQLVRRIFDEATDRDCDHVFLLGRRRSGFGAIFSRDPIREALDDFDGFATIGRERNPERRYVRVPEEPGASDRMVEFSGTWY